MWLFLPQGLFNAVALGFLIFGIFNFNNIRKELKINNYVIANEKVTPYIKRKYKSLCTSYIILNWICLTVYFVGGLILLLVYIIAYFHNLINQGINNFGYLVIQNNNDVLVIVMWVVVATMLFFLLWQIISYIINHKRKSEIELYYQQDIITDEMVQKYKKSANKKGLAIFLICTIAISLTVLVVWLVLRKLSISSLIKK